MKKKKSALIGSYAILKSYVIPFNSFYVTVFGMVRCYIKENENSDGNKLVILFAAIDKIK